ncbi:DUF397 domain-containing protein [Streptomyces sp. GS7]|uniref:DUF397 domain-containing protein n=1 Tax=Streptomyces sp. GS7 TaxID=2692234 RepID=UPI00131610F7|nr:DUF397 domain-containing protein [Streptomyces sp. GS7]QHC21199.1 DUF397 domain-containing protein [Streptomyces sp. GS7]
MSPDLDLAAATWIKSSYSEGNGGACVEFTRDFTWVKSSYSDANGGDCIEFSPAHSATHGVVPVRDSKVPDGPAIVASAAGWSSFVAAVKNGGFPS